MLVSVIGDNRIASVLSACAMPELARRTKRVTIHANTIGLVVKLPESLRC